MLIAICDDEPIFHEELTKHLELYYIQNHLSFHINHFFSGVQLLSSSLNFDIIFMDYKMSDINGLETSRQIRLRNNEVKIIFISNYPEIVFDSFEVNTFRFLVKPICKEKLFEALNYYRESLDTSSYFIMRTHEEIRKIKHSNIIYLEAHKKHTLIRTIDNYYILKKNLSEAKKALPTEMFVQCQRAYIVNIRYVSNYNTSTIFFDNNEKAKLGKKYKSNFKKVFLEYILSHNGL